MIRRRVGRSVCSARTPLAYTLTMRPVAVLLPLLTLSALTVSSAQSGDPARALFQSCGGVQDAGLPSGVKPGIYRGLLGSQPITLELSGKSGQGGGEQADRYSYDRYGLDIALDRGRPGNRTASDALLAVESVDDFGDFSVRGCLELAANGNGLQGAWRTPDGQKRLAVSLKPVNVAAVPLALPASSGLLKLRQSDPYTFLKLNRPWARVPGGLKEAYTGVSFPRVVGGTAALNAALQDRQLKQVQDAFDCRGGDGINLKNGTDFSGTGTLSWQSARLVSLHEDVEYYCGGAHPDNYTSGATLDARTGRELTLTGKPGSLWPGLSKTGLQKLYAAGYKEDGDIAECLDMISVQEVSTEYDNYTLYLTRQGLALWPTYLPHVAGACAEVVTVPYAQLRPLADPKSLYFRDLYPR